MLSGVCQRLDHLSYLGVDAILLSSFYDSPFEHLGRDIRDFTTISSKYGSIEDFDLLVTELRRLGNRLCCSSVCLIHVLAECLFD